VTFFGIFLTPVFFYVIEGFVETPLFSSKRLGRLGQALRDAARVLTLGLPWLPRALGGSRRSTKRSDRGDTSDQPG
jgi:hypothetical protein